MKKTVIGVAGNEISDAGEVLHHLPIAYTPLGYVKAIQNVGGMALILPISEAAEAKDYIAQIDKLVLAGGQNVAPKFYGQQLMTLADESFLARDEFELALIEEALLQKKPIFAVCRGMQLLNVALGGSLYQDISNYSEIHHMQAPVPKEVPTHSIETKSDSMLQQIYGSQTMVNSFHHQAIEHLASDFRETAWSPDQLIEGIEDKKRRLLGVQWHPDFAYNVLPQEMAAFQFVVEQL